jgi:shikimate kinase
MAGAICHGAATIITAFATGKGGAFGIDLWTKADVKLNSSGEVKGKIKEHPDENTLLIESAVRRTLEHFGHGYGAKVETESSIPVAAGLKSSSVAANATALATAGALAKKHGMIEGDGIVIDDNAVDPLDLVRIGVEAAFDAKVTVTGAFDDATASYFGGYTLTDNTKKELVVRGEMEDARVLIFLPEDKTYSGGLDVSKTKAFADQIGTAWEGAREGNVYGAITLNGLIHSMVFAQDSNIALAALNAGALASGLSGTGPATIALTKDRVGEIRTAWSGFEGRIIEAKTNNTQAHIV